MMTAMKTTPALISFLTSDAIEGFREKAYDDLQPDLDLNPGDEHLVRGTITYGSGLIRRPDGTRLRLGDTITRQENFDRVQKYVRENVEPVIENLIHVPLWGSAYDAIGSIIYNFGAAEVSGWRLWGRINRGDPPSDLAMEWLTGTWTSKGMPLLGLYRRRVMEVLMFFKLDWKPGANITWDDKVLNVLGSLGWDGTMPKPEVMPAPIPAPPSPKPEPVVLESDALNKAQEERLKQAAPQTVRKTKVVETPNLKPDAPAKALEDSKTAKGYAKEKAGQEAAYVGGTAAAITAALPLAKELTGFLKGVDIHTVLMAGAVFGGGMLALGGWRWWRGLVIKWEGRQEAEGPKV